MHIFYAKTAAVLLLLGSTTGLTLPKRQPPSEDITAQQLLQIAPDSGSCSGAQYPSECATADEAAPFINDAFAKYGINTMAEKAALISLMVSETGDFKANINHNSVGQGTRNMQMFNFNEEYANTFPQLQGQVSSILSTASPNDAKVAILALVLPNEYSFGTASWFYTTQCSAAVRSAVQTGGLAGFESYLSNCVVTTVNDRVTGIYARAAAALGVVTSKP